MTRDVILVTGSRGWTELATMQAWLRPALAMNRTLVHGGAKGADLMADSIARGMGVSIEARPVSAEEWDAIGKAAGHRRNERMVSEFEARIRRVFAFPIIRHGEMTPGTRHCVQICLDRGLPVTVVPPGARP